MSNNPSTSTAPLVVVHMITYNHGRYIGQAIESVLSQETTFGIRLCITEDHGSDDTVAVCRKYQSQYPGIIDFVANPENLGPAANSAKNLHRCFASGAKYLAILEGDDYWCDKLKLQKQVEMLNKHSDKYSICFTDINYVDEQNGLVIANFIRKFYKDKGFADQADILTGVSLPTPATLVNLDDMHRNLPEDFEKIYNADSYFFSLLTLEKNAVYLDEVTACYRLHAGGIMSGIGETGRLKKTIESIFFLFKRPVLRTDSRLKLKLRVFDLQVQILNTLVNGGYVSRYIQEFFIYVQYSFKFWFFKGFAMQLNRFLRICRDYVRHKLWLS